MSPIVRHPDVLRMLMTMKALTAAARAICFLTAEVIDRSHRSADKAEREVVAARASLLTPVAKAFSTDIANEVASLGIQVHGGMGYIEETGAAQYLRDARIAAIYEGTNGIQAIDLVQRKLGLSEGETVGQEIADMRQAIAPLAKTNAEGFGAMESCLREAVDALERATSFLQEASTARPNEALAGATPYLRLFGIARGGSLLAKGALAAHRLAHAGNGDPLMAARITAARFFAENIAPAAHGLAYEVTRGAGSVLAGAEALGSQ